MNVRRSFEELYGEYLSLNFSIPYRMRIIDGKIEEYDFISEEMAAWLEFICHFYYEADDRHREKIRQLFDGDDKLWHLHMFADRYKGRIKNANNVPEMRLALAALSIEDGRFDSRDQILKFNSIMRLVKSAGIDALEILKDLADNSNTQTRSLFLSYRP